MGVAVLGRAGRVEIEAGVEGVVHGAAGVAHGATGVGTGTFNGHGESGRDQDGGNGQDLGEEAFWLAEVVSFRLRCLCLGELLWLHQVAVGGK